MQLPSTPRRSGLLRRIATAVLASALALLAAEVVARLLVSPSRFLSPAVVDDNLAWARTQSVLQPDDELGFVPRLGTPDYDEFGLQRTYGKPVRGSRGTLCLFLGDSVTRRGTLTEPLRTLLGDAVTTMVSAGVESWNPVQEVGFYLRHQRQLAAEHVVLSLHNNDLTATSLGLWIDGEFALCSPAGRTTVHPTLYHWSMLYRMFVHSSFVHGAHPRNYTRDADAVEAALVRLRSEVVDRGARLTVLLLPILANEAQWQDHERRARELELAMLQRLCIETIDLQPACAALCAAGIPVRADAADPWHPDAATGAVLAAAAASELARHRPVVRATNFAVDPNGAQELRVRAGPGFAGRRCLVVPLTAVTAEELRRALTAPPVASAAVDTDGDAVLHVAPAAPGAPGVRWHAVVLAGAGAEDATRVLVVPPVPMVLTR